MKKALKAVAIVVLVVVVLFIFATVALNVLVKPEFIRNQITRFVSEKMHREIKIQGRLTWSLFPRITVRANHLSLGNPDGFMPDNGSFLEIQQLDLGLELLPLLEGKAAVNHLAVNGMTAHFIVNAQGNKNWEVGSTKINEKPDVNIQDTTKKTDPLNLHMQSMLITNSTISYEDLSKKQKAMLTNVNVKSNNISENHPFNFSASSDFDLGNQRKGTAEVSTEILIQSNGKQIQLGNLQSRSQIQLPGMSPIKLIMSGSLLADIDRKHFSLTEFEGSLDAAQFSGAIETDYSNDPPTILAKLKVNAQPKRFFALMNQALPAFQDSTALSQMSGRFEIQATPNSFIINKLQLTLDNSTLTGSAGVSDFSKKIFQFGLSLDQLDLDRYKVKNASASTAVPASSGAPSAAANKKGAAAAPPAAIKGWGGAGSLSIGSLKTANMTLNNTTMSVSANQGIYNVNPVKTYVYQGSYIGQLTYNSLTSNVNLKGALTGVDVQPLAKDLSSITKLQVSGKADINENLTTQGSSVNDLVRNLNGNVLLVLNNGVLHGIDLPYYYALGKSLLDKQSTLTVTNTNQTQFGNLSGSFNISQGVATNNDLLLQGSVLQAKGQGTFDLVNQKINYQLTVTPGAINNQPIPLKITGTFDKVLIAPDIEAIAKTQLQQQAKKQLQGKVTDLLEKNVGKETTDKIVKSITGLIPSQ